MKKIKITLSLFLIMSLFLLPIKLNYEVHAHENTTNILFYNSEEVKSGYDYICKNEKDTYLNDIKKYLKDDNTNVSFYEQNKSDNITSNYDVFAFPLSINVNSFTTF